MSKIIKNNTGSDAFVSDVGINVQANSSYTIPPQDYPLWAASNNIVGFIGAGTLIVNDGSQDLDKADAIRHIQSTHLTLDPQDTIDTKIRGNQTISLLKDIIKQLKVLNYQMSMITDYEEYKELEEERL